MHHTYIYIFIHISRIKTSLSQYSISRSFLFSISHYFPRRSLRPEIGRSDATTPDSLHPPTWPSANPRLLLLRLPVFAYARSEIHAWSRDRRKSSLQSATVTWRRSGSNVWRMSELDKRRRGQLRLIEWK